MRRLALAVGLLLIGSTLNCTSLDNATLLPGGNARQQHGQLNQITIGPDTRAIFDAAKAGDVDAKLRVQEILHYWTVYDAVTTINAEYYMMGEEDTSAVVLAKGAINRTLVWPLAGTKRWPLAVRGGGDYPQITLDYQNDEMPWVAAGVAGHTFDDVRNFVWGLRRDQHMDENKSHYHEDFDATLLEPCEAQALLKPLVLYRTVQGTVPATIGEAYQWLGYGVDQNSLLALQTRIPGITFYSDSASNTLALHLSGNAKPWLLLADPSKHAGLGIEWIHDPARIELSLASMSRMGGLESLGAEMLQPLQLGPHLLAGFKVYADDAQRKALENRAKLTLRALGSSQLAYQDSNLEKNYGSYQDMLDTEYIQQGYTRENLIDEYTIVVFYSGASGTTRGEGFQLIAAPKDPNSNLRTFGICDDQTIRVAPEGTVIIPNEGNSVPQGPAPCDWEPLR